MVMVWNALILPEYLVDCNEELIYIDRFGEVIARPRDKQALDLCCGGVGANDDDRNCSCLGVFLKPAEYFTAMHVG